MHLPALLHLQLWRSVMFHLMVRYLKSVVGRINGQFVINPTIKDLATSDIDIMVAASYESIIMVEGEMKEISEEEMVQAIMFAHEAIKQQCIVQNELVQMLEPQRTVREYCHETNDPEFQEVIKKATYQKIYEIAKKGNSNKKVRKEMLDAVKEEFVKSLTEEEQEEKSLLIDRYFHLVEKEAIRNSTLDNRRRLDGRKLDRKTADLVRGRLFCLLLTVQRSSPVGKLNH